MTFIRVNPIAYILLQAETIAVRFWFGLTSIFFGIFMASDPVSKWEYTITFAAMPYWLWGIGFIISGAAIIRGAYTSKYSYASMFIESVLGTILWVGVAVSSMMSQGTPGAITIAALMSIWLLVRYPNGNPQK